MSGIKAEEGSGVLESVLLALNRLEQGMLLLSQKQETSSQKQDKMLLILSTLLEERSYHVDSDGKVINSMFVSECSDFGRNQPSNPENDTCESHPLLHQNGSSSDSHVSQNQNGIAQAGHNGFLQSSPINHAKERIAAVCLLQSALKRRIGRSQFITTSRREPSSPLLDFSSRSRPHEMGRKSASQKSLHFASRLPSSVKSESAGNTKLLYRQHAFETCKVLNLKSPRYSNVAKADHSIRGQILSCWKQFLDVFFGIVDPDVRLGIEGSKLIHPNSVFHHGFQGCSAILLMYSALMVPVHLSFWEKEALECIPPSTLQFDMFVDLYFCVEVILHFFLAVDMNGRLVDDLKEVARIYVVSGRQFWFDVVTSFPFAWVEWAMLQHCHDERSTSVSSITSLLRVFKMLRFVKILKLHGLLDELFSTQPTVLRFVVLVLGLFLATHLATCAFWKVKTSTSTEEEVAHLLHDSHVGEDSTSDIYVYSSYLVFSFLSTIGYSEISGTTTGERLYYIALMVLGVCMFGTVLTEIQRVVSSLSSSDRELEDHLSSVISFFRNYRVPRSLERSVKQWTQLRFMSDKAELARQTIIHDLPEELSLALAVCLDSELFSHVALLTKIHGNVTKIRFVAQLVLLLKSTCFRAHHVLARQDTPADRLIIITAGRVKVCVSTPAQEQLGAPPTKIYAMKKGDSFGACSILGDPRWAGEFGINADFISEEAGTIAYIYTRDILSLLEREEFKEIRDQLRPYAYTPSEGEKGEDEGGPEAAAGEDGAEREVDIGSVRRVFHWIRVAKRLLASVASARWTFAILKAQENLASEELLEQALHSDPSTQGRGGSLRDCEGGERSDPSNAPRAPSSRPSVDARAPSSRPSFDAVVPAAAAAAAAASSSLALDAPAAAYDVGARARQATPVEPDCSVAQRTLVGAAGTIVAGLPSRV